MNSYCCFLYNFEEKKQSGWSIACMEKIAASILWKVFINGNERYHSIDAPWRMCRELVVRNLSVKNLIIMIVKLFITNDMCTILCLFRTCLLWTCITACTWTRVLREYNVVTRRRLWSGHTRPCDPPTQCRSGRPCNESEILFQFWY